jgi:hypothetical protein
MATEHESRKEKAMVALQQKEKAKQFNNFYRFQKNEQFKAGMSSAYQLLSFTLWSLLMNLLQNKQN